MKENYPEKTRKEIGSFLQKQLGGDTYMEDNDSAKYLGIKYIIPTKKENYILVVVYSLLDDHKDNPEAIILVIKQRDAISVLKNNPYTAYRITWEKIEKC